MYYNDTHDAKNVILYSSHNGFRIKSEIKLSEYNCNQDLVSSITENQTGFSISTVMNTLHQFLPQKILTTIQNYVSSKISLFIRIN